MAVASRNLLLPGMSRKKRACKYATPLVKSTGAAGAKFVRKQERDIKFVQLFAINHVRAF